MIRLEGIAKEYYMGDVVVRALDGIDLEIQPRRVCVHYGTLRFGEIHAAQHFGRLGSAQPRRVLPGRAWILPSCGTGSWPKSAIGILGSSFRPITSSLNSQPWKT